MRDNEIRMDKFLWAVRIFKTRTLAAEACAKGQVTINDLTVKPSRHVLVGEIMMVRKPPMVYTYRVLGLIHNRLSAEKAKEYIEELTPDEEFKKMELIRLQRNSIRDRGTGRPTKRDRRDIERFTGNS
jgi:ribosome-associated heat shock protein Hsp15